MFTFVLFNTELEGGGLVFVRLKYSSGHYDDGLADGPKPGTNEKRHVIV